MKKVLTNARVYTGNEILTGTAILVNGGKIAGFVYDSDIPEGYEVQDLCGHNIAPAFIDLQIYGGNGYLFSAAPSLEAIAATEKYCRAGGAANFLLTMATNAREVFSKGIAVAKEYLRNGGTAMLGLHIEGPWINTEKRGAHLAEFIHSPDLDEAKKLVDEAEGVIKMITLAPEVVDESIIDYLQSSGIVIAAGHTNATYKEAKESFKRIRVATHLFNAMSQFQSRSPGMVAAIYDHPTVCSSIVADGVHVDFAAIRISKKIMGDRLYLITDAVTETKDGPYEHRFQTDRFVMPDGTLSGSSLTMMSAVRNCVQQLAIEPDEALRMASLYPARVMGLESAKGKIAKNMDASFVVFDEGFNVIDLL